MLGERYREVRYETLCADCTGTMVSLLDWLGLAVDFAALERLAGAISGHSIGKHRKMPRRRNREVLRLIEPTLASLGYVAPRSARVFGLVRARRGL